MTLDDLRRYAVRRSLFAPTTLAGAINKLGFVQADPIRSPARAQDLILRHRVRGYLAGDLEKHYPKLAIEEDFFVNYGFMPRQLADLMHPRAVKSTQTPDQLKNCAAIADFVRERGVVKPAQVDAHFQHGTASNWFGGKSRVSTQLMDRMHFSGQLRTAYREDGIRSYALRDPSPHGMNDSDALDRLIDVCTALYAPLPAKTLGYLVSLLMRGVPQWKQERNAALLRAKTRLASAMVDNVLWYWPAHENPQSSQYSKHVATQNVEQPARFLAPFDPVVWDRTRFELLWRWPYRFEAYTPTSKRLMGYYAMPLLLGDQVVGFGNLDATGHELDIEIGLKHKVSQVAVKRALASELVHLSQFLSKPIGRLGFL